MLEEGFRLCGGDQEPFKEGFLELLNFSKRGAATHRPSALPTPQEKQRHTSSVKALLGTALFFFAQPFGWVR